MVHSQYSNSLKQEKATLFTTARQAIQSGLKNEALASLNLNNYSDDLTQKAATFVTLSIEGRLRGCIGSLEAHRPLIEDIYQNAYAAAFKDPRFPPLRQIEYPTVKAELSILTPLQIIHVENEEQLKQILRPEVDGLLIDDGIHRATFLPHVWESLKTPEAFLDQLKLKAGMEKNKWSDAMRCWVYQSIKLEE